MKKNILISVFLLLAVFLCISIFFIAFNTRYTLKISANEGGNITVDTQYELKKHETVQIKAEPIEGYVFDKWITSNGGAFQDETIPNTVFKMPSSDTEITALFKEKPKYDLNVKATEGGIISSSNTATLYEGEQIELSAERLVGFLFVEWKSSNGGEFSDSKSLSTTFTMPDNDTEISAVFEVNNTLYNLSITTTEGGGVPAGLTESINGQYREGDEIKLIVRPMPDYVFVEWVSSNGGEFSDKNDSGATFIMPANDTEICGIFKKRQQ